MKKKIKKVPNSILKKYLHKFFVDVDNSHKFIIYVEDIQVCREGSLDNIIARVRGDPRFCDSPPHECPSYGRRPLCKRCTKENSCIYIYDLKNFYSYIPSLKAAMLNYNLYKRIKRRY